MRKRTGALLLTIAFVVGGCTAPQVAPPETPAPAPASAAVEAPLTCRTGTAPTVAEMTELLARVSTYAPLTYLTGPALALEQQWLEMEQSGWPPDAGGWVTHPWTALEIAPAANQAFVVHLAHGEYVTQHDWFRVICSDGTWKVEQQAKDRAENWLEPTHPLPGQDGELTPALVGQLVGVARTGCGPWAAQVATGDALYLDKVDALDRSRGFKIYDRWRFATGTPALTQTDAAQVEANYGNYRLRLDKSDGLWKIADSTEGGAWIGRGKERSLAAPGPIFDPPFGVLLGKSDECEIKKLFGTPDSVAQSESGQAYTYAHRKLEVRFDAGGKVTAFRMRTGAPPSGVRVGSPVALWDLVYRPASQTTPDPRISVQNGIITEITATR